MLYIQYLTWSLCKCPLRRAVFNHSSFIDEEVEFEWLYQDHLSRESQTRPTNRSIASFSLTHSGERNAPPVMPTGLCINKYLYHHNAFQLCIYVVGGFRMPNLCGSVSLTSELKRHKQPKTFKKGSLYSWTYLSEIKVGVPFKILLHFYISSL